MSRRSGAREQRLTSGSVRNVTSRRSSVSAESPAARDRGGVVRMAKAASENSDRIAASRALRV